MPAAKRVRRSAATSGHTMAELLIVLIVSAILMTMTIKGTRWIGQSTLSLRDRARLDAELRLAVQSILQDLGGAESALPTVDGDLLITREQAVAELAGAWSGGADDGILYHVADGHLIRSDLELLTEFEVATLISGWEVTRPGTETDIAFSVGADDDLRDITLVFPE